MVGEIRIALILDPLCGDNSMVVARMGFDIVGIPCCTGDCILGIVVDLADTWVVVEIAEESFVGSVVAWGKWGFAFALAFGKASVESTETDRVDSMVLAWAVA